MTISFSSATDSERNLLSGFLASARRFPSRIAVEADNTRVTYGELSARAGRVCSTLATVPHGECKLTGILGNRSSSLFAGMLGVLMRGHGYVPLGLDYPIARNVEMLTRSGARTLVVDRAGVPSLPALLEAMSDPVTVLLLESDPEEVAMAATKHRIVGPGEFPAACSADRRAPLSTDPAYVLFTSGTTGRPKAVPVSHANVRAFLDAAQARYRATPDDRFSQTFSLTFDLSVFDLFVAWDSGACVCCATDGERLMPGRYIKDRQLSFWFSVPSLAVRMGRMKQLTPNQYPSLRYSLFCGEALPRSVTETWAAAAPNSVVENLYGPTELTIACTWYQWDAARSPAECENGLVPIGQPIPGMSTFVADERLREVPPGECGELCMTGPQLTRGYLDDPEKTNAAFVRIEERDATYYRTGDLVRRPVQAEEPLQFLGRRDTQVKIRGFRVELGEVEAAIREHGKTEVAVAVAWPRTESGADGIIVLVDEPAIDVPALSAHVREVLPNYMVPQEIRLVPALPRNSNGKIDRAAVEALLVAEAS